MGRCWHERHTSACARLPDCGDRTSEPDNLRGRPARRGHRCGTGCSRGTDCHGAELTWSRRAALAEAGAHLQYLAELNRVAATAGGPGQAEIFAVMP